MLSCALGWVVAKISLKLKNKSLDYGADFACVHRRGYYFLYFKAQTLDSAICCSRTPSDYGEAVKGRRLPRSTCFGADGRRRRPGHGRSMPAGTAGCSSRLLWLAACPQLPENRHRVRRDVSRRRVYRRGGGQAGHKRLGRPAVQRSFRRFIASPDLYAQLRPGHSAAAARRRPAPAATGRSLLATLECRSSALNCRTPAAPLLLAGAICMLASMNDITAPSVSLEGKSLWLLQSLPVTPWQAHAREALSAQLAADGRAASDLHRLRAFCRIPIHRSRRRMLVLALTLALYELFPAAARAYDPGPENAEPVTGRAKSRPLSRA